MKDVALPPLLDEPKILEDVHNTWSIENWRAMGKREHGPIFQAGGYPWCVMVASQGLPHHRVRGH